MTNYSNLLNIWSIISLFKNMHFIYFKIFSFLQPISSSCSVTKCMIRKFKYIFLWASSQLFLLSLFQYQMIALYCRFFHLARWWVIGAASLTQVTHLRINESKRPSWQKISLFTLICRFLGIDSFCLMRCLMTNYKKILITIDWKISKWLVHTLMHSLSPYAIENFEDFWIS